MIRIKLSDGALIEHVTLEREPILPPRRRPLDEMGQPLPRRCKYPSGQSTKPCTGCNLDKPLEEFNPSKNGALGRSSRCSACIRADGLEYTRLKREARAKRQRPEHCECCGSERQARALAWDHDHVTGEFRGWLCFSCNAAIGHAGDSVERLQLLINYLERPRENIFSDPGPDPESDVTDHSTLDDLA